MKHKWTLDELIDHWTVLPDDQLLMERYKTTPNKLGVVLLLKYFEIEGRFPRRQRDIPQAAVEFVARQLNIPAAVFAEYNWRGRAIKYHRATIRRYLGFREGTVADAEAVSDWLCAHVLAVEATLDGVIAAAYERYRMLRIEPPAAGRVERLVRSAQRRYSEQFCEEIAARLTIETKQALDRLLERGTDKDGNLTGHSSFARLKRDAGAVSLKNILAEIEKLQRIRRVALPETLFASVPPHVVELYRQRVTGERPSEVKRHSDALRYTLLAAFCWLRGQEITDNLIELFNGVIKRIGKNAEKSVNRKLLQEVQRVRGKSKLLCEIAKASIATPTGIVSEVIYPVANEETLKRVIKEHETVDAYDIEPKRTARRSYARHYRRMMPPLFKALAFSSDNEALRSLMKAVDLIQRYVGTSYKYYRDEDEVPLEDVVSAAWLNEVVQVTRSGKLRINRISYEMCVFQTLREQLRCRAVWVQGANCYRNPDDDMPADFTRRRDSYYEALQQPQDAEAFTDRLRQEMVHGLSRLNEGLPRNGWLTLEMGRKHPLKLSPLPA